MIDPRGLYTAMEELEKEIRQQLMNEAEIQLQFPQHQQDGPNYRTVQALAAVYTLQDWLANDIAELIHHGELDPDPED